MNLRKSLKHWQRSNWFRELVLAGEGRVPNSSTIPRLYVLVRDDLLPPIHQGIQAAHACVLLAHITKVDPQSYIILLGATRAQMADAVRNTRTKFAQYIDIGLVDPETGYPVHTATAFEPMSLAKGNRMFGHLRRSE